MREGGWMRPKWIREVSFTLRVCESRDPTLMSMCVCEPLTCSCEIKGHWGAILHAKYITTWTHTDTRAHWKREAPQKNFMEFRRLLKEASFFAFFSRLRENDSSSSFSPNGGTLITYKIDYLPPPFRAPPPPSSSLHPSVLILRFHFDKNPPPSFYLLHSKWRVSLSLLDSNGRVWH